MGSNVQASPAVPLPVSQQFCPCCTKGFPSTEQDGHFYDPAWLLTALLLWGNTKSREFFLNQGIIRCPTNPERRKLCLSTVTSHLLFCGVFCKPIIKNKTEKEIREKNHGVDYYNWTMASWSFVLSLLAGWGAEAGAVSDMPKGTHWLLVGPKLKGTQMTTASATFCFLHILTDRKCQETALNVCPSSIKEWGVVQYYK